MRITQGTFSFLPDLTDEQIAAQIRILTRSRLGDVGRVHRRPPSAQLVLGDVGSADVRPDARTMSTLVMREVRACREAYPDHYIKLIAYDASYGRQTTALSFIVNRPAHEPGFRLDRTDAHDRVMRYRAASVRGRSAGREAATWTGRRDERPDGVMPGRGAGHRGGGARGEHRGGPG